jgi:hypothetical protein
MRQEVNQIKIIINADKASEERTGASFDTITYYYSLFSLKPSEINTIHKTKDNNKIFSKICSFDHLGTLKCQTDNDSVFYSQ